MPMSIFGDEGESIPTIEDKPFRVVVQEEQK